MEMDEGEVCLAILFGVVGSIWLGRHGWRVAHITPLAAKPSARVPLWFTPFVSLGTLWIVLLSVAAKEVRTTPGYQVLFVGATATAFAFGTTAFSALGLDPARDGVERSNRAARLAVVGLWIAITICSIGANIGEGDTVLSTLIPLALGTLALAGLTGLLSAATDGLPGIVIEHDVRAGMRLVGLLVAWSFPLAHASAGDWQSVSATLHDFKAASPMLLALLCAGIFVEKQMPSLLWPAALYPILAAIATWIR